MQKKDKEKVLDEVWTTERVKDFLALHVPAGENPDFYLLHMAYKNMRLENFEEFLAFFTAAGKDLNAKDSQDRTVLDLIKSHKKGQGYAAALESAIKN
ncbi:MAG: PA4642 family protein [Cellvibrionales bacterium]|nr:PA4642 family protein [Cellvibrionales bacterium]